MKIKVFEEQCCDHCHEVVHNHIDCPVCGVKYAGTNVHHSLHEDMEDEGEAEMGCDCGARFKAVNQKKFAMRNWEWERVK